MKSVAIKSIKRIRCKPIKVYDISVPKTSNFVLSNGLVVHNCKPYQYLRSTIYEKRLEMYENTLLTEELLGLERDNNSGKIDHSPSSINCFTGDTKISLTDGRELSILELKYEFEQGKLNYVYSFNECNKKIEPKIIESVFCSGKNAKLIKVTLDNGETIRCTPEHRFMLRDGSYIEAQNLVTLDSLMPNKHQSIKVLSIEFINDTEDVYDITVKDNHNFALSAGVFVHNSKDQSDALTGCIYNASNNAEQFAFDYGEDMQVAIETNTGDAEQQGENISQQFEQELGKLLIAKSNVLNSPFGFDLNNTNTKSTTPAFPYAQNGIVLW